MIKDCLLKNKLLIKNLALGLLCGLLTLVFAILVSDLLYRPKKMARRGFEVEIKAESANADVVDSKSKNKLGAKKDVKQVDIVALIKTADIDAGAKVFKKCATCHTIEKGGANKVGPNLHGIVGRSKASLGNFAYSAALKGKGGAWSIQDLNLWLTKPKDFVPGTKMPFAGLPKDQDRANVIAYLKQNS